MFCACVAGRMFASRLSVTVLFLWSTAGGSTPSSSFTATLAAVSL